MYWGVMTGGWIRGALDEEEDYYEATVRLVARHGLNACQWSAAALLDMSRARREGLAELLREHNVHAVLALRAEWLSEDADERRRGIDRCLEAVETLPAMMRTPIFTTTAGRYHRFMRSPSLEQQMDGLAEALAPVARAAHRGGCPLGIENHGDYYCSDLAALCERTPHLGIFLDTGNTFLIGERPVPAVRDAAPYVVGTHFKDHQVSPRFRPLGFEIRGAVPGEGDVGLREAYRILVENAPAPDGLAMILEIDSVQGAEPEEALRRAVQFVQTLQ
jgi:sugar phosphate isomerase/epimerase